MVTVLCGAVILKFANDQVPVLHHVRRSAISMAMTRKELQEPEGHDERTTGARDCKTPVPSVQMSNVQRTMMSDVVVRAPDNPSES